MTFGVEVNAWNYSRITSVIYRLISSKQMSPRGRNRSDGISMRFRGILFLKKKENVHWVHSRTFHYGGFHQERGGHAPARTKIQMRSTDGKRKAALFLDPISSFSFGWTLKEENIDRNQTSNQSNARDGASVELINEKLSIKSHQFLDHVELL